MTYVFDIDGTICSKTNGDYELASPIKERIDYINKLYNQGNKIIFQTARGMVRSNNSYNHANSSFYELTLQQLNDWVVKFH